MKNAVKQRSFLTFGRPLLSDLSAFARDISNAFSQLTELELISFTATYTEPLNVGFDHEPSILLAGRVRQEASPETAVNGNARVAFVWNAARGQLQISNVDGCTVGVKYRFNFMAVG